VNQQTGRGKPQETQGASDPLNGLYLSPIHSALEGKGPLFNYSVSPDFLLPALGFPKHYFFKSLCPQKKHF
jgi:hypothetical protein